MELSVDIRGTPPRDEQEGEGAEKGEEGGGGLKYLILNTPSTVKVAPERKEMEGGGRQQKKKKERGLELAS